MANIIASDNPFPSILIAEATEPAAPAAGHQRLYVDSTTHVLMITNSSGTQTPVAGSGLTDPMTTRGDVIVRDASNVTARLAIGSSGKVLSSNGTDISWQTPSSGFSPVFDMKQRSGPYTTTSGSVVAVDGTNLVLSMTTTARRVLILVTCHADHSAIANNVYLVYKIDSGAYQAVSQELSYGIPKDAAGSSGGIMLTASWLTTVLSAGAHTFTLGWATDAATATLSNISFIGIEQNLTT